MYEKFYNLKKQPFHVTPDPQFLYLSESHKQALASIMYGIEKRKGFVTISGGVGVGKTTVVRTYLETTGSADLKVIYVFHANITFPDLVKAIYRELGLDLTTTDLIEMVDGLHLALIELYRQGKTAVVIIDEAQNMPIETLENLRMLSNLETPTDKLIQVVLVGQTELEDLLEKHELRQLHQRIAVQARIVPLSAQESHAYVAHRLSVAGLDNTTVFSKEALDIIIRAAKGIPRTLNILCDNTLITAFGYQKNPVTPSIAKEAVSDFTGKQTRSLVQRWKGAGLAVGVSILAFVVAFFLSPYGHVVVEMLNDGGLKQATTPEPVSVPLSQPLGEPPLRDPVRKVSPHSESIQPQESKAATPFQPRDKQDQKRPAAAATYKTRVVKRGETLSNLIRDVYRVSPDLALQSLLIDLVREHNPAIIDPNLIVTGSVIRFPELPSER